MTIQPQRLGLLRRDFLLAGVAGGLGLTLADQLRRTAAGFTRPSNARGAIFIYLAGGPSHIDTFDPKPNAPAEYHGEFNPIPTNVPGLEICEHLPRLAAVADKFDVLRGVSHNLAAHDLGTQYLVTGNRPVPSVRYPGYGSVVSKERPATEELPSYVAIPSTPEEPGYLGPGYAALNTQQRPRPGREFTVRGLTPAGGLKLENVRRREQLLNDLDATLSELAPDDQLLSGLDQFQVHAFDIIRSKRTREAFDISRASPAVARRFGGDEFSQSCLLACRLIEAGVTFVTVNFGGWDTHGNNFPKLRDENLPQLDAGLAGLVETLNDTGLLPETSVLVTGEFGRTPKINKQAGRDHWPRAMCVLAAGGRIAGGQVIGATDDRGEAPTDVPITPDDVAASFYHSLGIDPATEYETNTGRPVQLVRNGRVIEGLFG